MLTKPVVVDELCIKKVSEILFIKNGIFYLKQNFETELQKENFLKLCYFNECMLRKFIMQRCSYFFNSKIK